MGLLTLALHGPAIFKILNRYEYNKFSGVCQEFLDKKSACVLIANFVSLTMHKITEACL